LEVFEMKLKYWNMKSSLLIMCFVVCTGLYAQKGKMNLSNWHKGDKAELSDFKQIKRTGLYYALSNDNDNLYIDLIIEARKDQNTILYNGLILWINMEEKAVRKMGIRYPMGSQNQGIRNKGFQTERGITPKDNAGNPLSMANTIEILGFIGERERHFPSDNTDNFRGWIKFDEAGKLHYRMVMPIVRLPIRNSRNGIGAMPFSLGIEYGFTSDSRRTHENVNPSQSYDYQSGGTRNGTNAKHKPGSSNRPGKNGKMSDENVGRNSKNQNIASGSELHWVKDIRLAISK
jgi:hypothetical protein